ncbi:MAG: IS3 family transposase [Nitrospira sp.]
MLTNAPKTFEVAQPTEREARLQRKNVLLKKLVGELTMELKKRRGGVAMSRRSPAIAQCNAPVLARIQALKADHPCWGDRRIWAQLHVGAGLVINKKRILRLMREQGWWCRPPRLKALRTPTWGTPRPTAPNQ